MTPDFSSSESSPAQLPALLPSTALLAKRAQTALGLLRDVVQESSAEHWYKQGRVADANTQWAEAAYTYRKCVELDPDHWRGEVRRASALAYLGQAEAAAGALTKASEAAVEGWQELVAELAEPAWYQLRDCMETSRSTAQDGFGLLLGLALVYRVLKQAELARRTLDVMQFMYQQQVAGSARWFRLSGNLHSDTGHHTEAIADYDRAIELIPNFAAAYFNRGHAKNSLKEFTEDIADYDRAIELMPNFAAAYHNRGGTKQNLQNYAGAISDYNRAIELMPDSAATHRNRGNAKVKLKDYTGAITDYDRAIELKPDFAVAYRGRGKAKSALEDYNGAVADYDRAIELNSRDANCYFVRGNAKCYSENYAGAIADYSRAIELEPEDANYYMVRGTTKEELKNYDEAIADYNLAIILKPEKAIYYSFRGDVKEEIGDVAGAVADRQRAAQLATDTDAD